MGRAAQERERCSAGPSRLAASHPMAIDARPRLGTQRAVAVAVVAAAAVLSLGIGATFEKDQETQSAQWIQGITERGEWLLPADDYGAIDRKPPLYYLLSAVGGKGRTGAVNEVGARLVSLVAGVLLAVALMRWSAAFVGESSGWLALAFVLGTYGFASRATVDLTDMLLSLLLFAAWCCVYRLLEEGGSRAAAIGGDGLLGLAVLTKGPVAIVLIGFAGLIYVLLIGRSPLEVVRRGWSWLMVSIALIVGACWYVPVFIEGGRPVTDVFLSENFGHFMPSALGGTGEASRPIWYIGARMFGGALPLSALVVALAIALWRHDGEEGGRGGDCVGRAGGRGGRAKAALVSTEHGAGGVDFFLDRQLQTRRLYSARDAGAGDPVRRAVHRRRDRSGARAFAVRQNSRHHGGAGRRRCSRGSLRCAGYRTSAQRLRRVLRPSAIERRRFSEALHRRDASSDAAVCGFRGGVDGGRARRLFALVCTPQAAAGRGAGDDRTSRLDALRRHTQIRVCTRAVGEDLRAGSSSSRR